MTTELAQKLEGVRDFKKILETVVKELGETYSADLSQIVLSNPLDHNITSICEYKLYPEVNPHELPISMSFPLPLEGPGLGAVTLARRNEFHENEVNWIRITLAELCDIIRHAQINDVVQRDTFRNTFLFEIQTLMQYSLGLGDALFMVVNILGKVLQASRCVFICVDDSQAGWKVYEFWQRERLQSCQDYGWPTTDSPIVARSLLTTSPLIIEEANQNSYKTPVQEELGLLDVRSLLGVPLRSETGTHGCIIVQHCERRHAWTRGEIDMVQNVADTVAEALNKLPAEKRSQEPIMRLHQREIIDGGDEKESILAVRRALRTAMVSSSIPTAQKSGVPKASKEVAKPQAAPASQQAPTPSLAAPPAAEISPPAPAPDLTFTPPGPPGPGVQTTPPNTVSSDFDSTISELTKSLQNQVAQEAGTDDGSSSLQDLLNGLRGPRTIDSDPNDTIVDMKSRTAAEAQAPADSPHAGVPLPKQQPLAQAASPPPPPAQAAGGGYNLADLDKIPTPGATGSAAPLEPALEATAPAPAAPTFLSELDAIPTPSNTAPGGKGLGQSMFGKRGAGNTPASPLLASLHRDKSRFQQDKPEYVDGGTLQIDEAQAEAKLKQIMATSNPTSDYIFSTPSVDARILGRIDSWVSQVEEKDKYNTPHAIQVAEYSVACGRLLGLSQQDLDAIRLAAIVHDVGKLGLPTQVLQKPEDELSDTELLLIMKHPIDGANLLEGFPELAHVAPIVLAHHEEYDGNGYPAGLAGDRIPLAARIIHVASDYHSMISPTKFRPAMTPTEAQQTMLGFAGKTYDPALVQVLIACVQQGMVAARR